MVDPKLVKIGSYIRRTVPKKCGCEYYKIIDYEDSKGVFLVVSFIRCKAEAHLIGASHYVSTISFEDKTYIIINPKDHFLYIAI